MRIAFDARWIHTSNLEGGMGDALEILTALLQIQPAHEYFILFDREDRKRYIVRHLEQSGIASQKYRALDIFSFTSAMRNWFILPFILRKLKIDWLISPSYVLPPFFKKYQIAAIIFDGIPQKAAESLRRRCALIKMVHLFPFLLRIILQSCDLIFTWSGANRQALTQRFGLALERVQLLSPAVPEPFFAAGSTEAIATARQLYPLPDRYILYWIETDRPNAWQNVENMLRAYAKLPLNLRQQLSLVLAGRTANEMQAKLELLIAHLGLREKVAVLGYVAAEHRIPILQAAVILVYLDQTKGCPDKVLQAMAQGIPAIAGRVYTETVKDGAHLIDTENPERVAESMLALLTNTAEYRDLIKRGRQITAPMRFARTANCLLLQICQNRAKK